MPNLHTFLYFVAFCTVDVFEYLFLSEFLDLQLTRNGEYANTQEVIGFMVNNKIGV